MIRTIGTDGDPKDQQLFISIIRNLNDGIVRRVYMLAYTGNFLFDDGNFTGGKSAEGENRQMVFVLFYSYNNISAAGIFNIIGKTANASQNS